MSGQVFFGHTPEHVIIKLVGELRCPDSLTLVHAIERCKEQSKTVLVDMRQTSFVDSTILGVLAELNNPQAPPELIAAPAIHQQLKTICFDTIFHFIDQCEVHDSLEQASDQAGNKAQLEDRVRKSHEHLIKIDKKHEKDYRRVIDCFQKKDSQ